MIKKTQLTILLTLRGRHLFTLRWLWYANRIKFPYHIIIADGEVHPIIDKLISDKKTFPNLSYEYHRYCDKTYADFYAKCVDACKKVKTKYVMMSDNDDFPILQGIEESIAFLNKEPSYIAAGGKVPSFSIAPGNHSLNLVTGRMNGLRFGYSYQCHDLSSDSARDRVLDRAQSLQVFYYHVFQVHALQIINDEIAHLGFTDLTVHEHFSALRAATLGKIRTNPSAICYLRQTGTSSGISISKDWVHHLLHSNIPQDFRSMSHHIANFAEKADASKVNALSMDILNIFEENLRIMLSGIMLRYRFPKLFKIKQTLVKVKKIRIVPYKINRYLWMKSFWKEMFIECSDTKSVDAYKSEILLIEHLLQENSFQNFINENAADIVHELQ